MTNLKHTPGPWFFNNDFTISNRDVTGDRPFGNDICLVFVDNYKNENAIKQSEVDGLLIAAAPEMLEAIISYLKRIEYAEEIDSMRSYKEFIDVVEKATGMKIDEVLK